jgi:ABC-type Fe3+-citrate transport system substrate-binding protein
MRRRPSDPTLVDAPTPTESGVYPIGVFSDAEVTMNLAEVEETLQAFRAIGARIRDRRRSSV